MTDTAIIGAGPYGLSIAAHFRSKGISFRIFGRTMDSWLAHMPKGMCLKSDGFASNIYDPHGQFTLKSFCEERKIEYSDAGIPVRLDTFASYGLAFQERMTPELENKMVTGIERCQEGFMLQLDNGETVRARRVVLAVGITHFAYVPENLRHLPEEFLTHSYAHHDLGRFRGRSVAVLGGGSSAIDLAGLLHEADADAELIARRESLKFHDMAPIGVKEPLWRRIRHPKSGLGPGLRSRIFSDAPGFFHALPESYRLNLVRTHLGPSGGWFIKGKVIGKVPLHMGTAVESAEVRGGRVVLQLRGTDGTRREISVDHVVAATGYRVDLDRLQFLSPGIRAQIKSVERTPILSSKFESSVRGLYFTGVAAANSFGPLMRFAFGAGFTARHLARVMMKSLARDHVSVAAPEVVSVAK